MVFWSRVFLALLFSSAIVSGADESWRGTFEQGVVADDYAEYDKAEKLLQQACDQASAETPLDQAEPCIRFANVFAVQGKYRDAESALEQLLARLAVRADTFPEDVVETLTELANVRSARGRFDESLEALRQCWPYLDRLSDVQIARSYLRFARFYLPADRQAPGGNLLRAAGTLLEENPDYADADYVLAAADLAATLQSSGRLRDAAEFLAPIVDEANSENAGPDLLRALAAAARVYEQVLRMLGRDGEAKGWGFRARAWNRVAAGPSVSDDGPHRIGNGVTPPQLKKKKDPTMTMGARMSQAQGTVLLQVEVWPDGRPHNIEVIRPLPYGLHWEAISAVRDWRFKPGTKDGSPVKIQASVEVNFQFR